VHASFVLGLAYAHPHAEDTLAHTRPATTLVSKVCVVQTGELHPDI